MIIRLIGDSIKVGWASRFVQMIASEHSVLSSGIVDGSSTAIVSNLATLINDSDNFCIINCGLWDVKREPNFDSACATDITTYGNNLQTIINYLKARNINIIFLYSTPINETQHNPPSPTGPGFYRFNVDINAYNAKMQEICDANSVECFDLNTWVNDNVINFYAVNSLYSRRTNDGVHYENDGYDLLAECIIDKFNDYNHYEHLADHNFSNLVFSINPKALKAGTNPASYYNTRLPLFNGSESNGSIRARMINMGVTYGYIDDGTFYTASNSTWANYLSIKEYNPVWSNTFQQTFIWKGTLLASPPTTEPYFYFYKDASNYIKFFGYNGGYKNLTFRAYIGGVNYEVATGNNAIPTRDLVYHIVLTIDNRTVKIYVNGTLLKTQASAFDISSFQSNNGMVYCRDDNNANVLKATMQRFDVYNSVFSQAQVTADYTGATIESYKGFGYSDGRLGIIDAMSCFSNGVGISDLKTGSPKIFILNGFATFDIAQIGNIGVGDCITYDTDKICYITGKISQTEWIVRTALGVLPLNSSVPKDVVSIKRTFNALSDALHGSTPGAYTLLGNSLDLITLNTMLNITCYADGDDSSFTTLDKTWVTDATCYIKIYTPKNTSTECNQNQRTDYILAGGGYTLNSSANTSYRANLHVSADYTRIEGIKVKRNSSNWSYAYCIGRVYSIQGENGKFIRIEKCFCIQESGGDNGTLIESSYVNATHGYGSIIRDNFVLSNSANLPDGINLEASYQTTETRQQKFYNNTVYGQFTGAGISLEVGDSAGSSYLPLTKNNYAYNSGAGSDYAFPGAHYSNADANFAYNASDDTTAGTSNNNRRVQIADAAVKSSSDLHLLPLSQLAGKGISINTDSNVATFDIDSLNRYKNVSNIGANEFNKLVRFDKAAVSGITRGVMKGSL